ncbi:MULTISPECIES: thioredoxin fold domain-containing protein [unclassified Thioalkalivibrio]|uniref:thioredoxin family protein n=1 Tax=unclassified Thioalkalivibrio TaxID=2621013 RepID=UPI00036848AE|nr:MULTISPECIES: thioredoxin fold domain-containing protein [unclassified Thioalkalivibrio]
MNLDMFKVRKGMGLVGPALILMLGGMLVSGVASAHGIERVTDLRSLAQNGDGKPTLIMFASDSCPYCDRAEHRHLGPMSEDANYDGIQIRKVMLDREEVRDFDGEVRRGHELGRAYGARVVPTIMAFDAEGNPVGEPLIGIPNEQLYRSQIRQRIQQALRNNGESS